MCSHVVHLVGYCTYTCLIVCLSLPPSLFKLKMILVALVNFWLPPAGVIPAFILMRNKVKHICAFSRAANWPCLVLLCAELSPIELWHKKITRLSSVKPFRVRGVWLTSHAGNIDIFILICLFLFHSKNNFSNLVCVSSSFFGASCPAVVTGKSGTSVSQFIQAWDGGMLMEGHNVNESNMSTQPRQRRGFQQNNVGSFG